MTDGLFEWLLYMLNLAFVFGVFELAFVWNREILGEGYGGICYSQSLDLEHASVISTNSQSNRDVSSS